MTRKFLTTLFVLAFAGSAFGGALSLSIAPDTTDNTTLLSQHQALSLWNIEHNGTRNVISSSTPSHADITTTSGTALAANTSRGDAVLTNYGAVGCFLARGATAVVGQGIYLAPNGGYYNIDANNLYRGVISAITASGTTTLSISEGQ